MMRIIYYSHWGTYAAYTMAALHTGLYPEDRLPPDDWIWAQHELCLRYGEQTGNLIYTGMDEQFTEIYTLGCRRHGEMIVRAIQHISDIFEVHETVHMISAESLDGMLPVLLQKLNSRDNSFTKMLFKDWFYRSYPKCQHAFQNGKLCNPEGNQGFS